MNASVKEKAGEEMQKPLLLPQKEWHNQLYESACTQKAVHTQPAGFKHALF